MAVGGSSKVNEEYDQLDESESEEEDDPKSVKLDGVLTHPHWSRKTARELHRMIHQGEIDLNPPYQRDVVWTDLKQSALCGSVIRNYYVPAILLLKSKLDDGTDVLVCVDGKQRLTSIQKFIDGQIHIKIKKGKWWFTTSEFRSRSRQILPDELKREFMEKELSCVIYDHLDPAVERDIFQRVQLGVQLSTAEKLQALATPWSTWLSELDQKHVRSDDGLTSVVKWDIKRGRNFQCIVQLLYCCDHLPQRSEPTSQKVETWLKNRTHAPTQHFMKQVDLVLNMFWNIGSTGNLNQAFTEVHARIAPVEFVFIGVLIAVLLGLPDETVSQEILMLRTRVRKVHSDVRANNRVYSTLWDFISDARTRHTKSGLIWVSTSENLEDQLTGKPLIIEKKGKRKANIDSDYRATIPRRKVTKTST